MKRNPVVPISDAVNGWLARRPYLREGLMEQRLIEVLFGIVQAVDGYCHRPFSQRICAAL